VDSLEKFINNTVEHMPKGMQSHIGTVVDIALELSDIYQCNSGEVYLAAKGHDIARLIPPHILIEMSQEYGIHICQVERDIPMLLHGPVGANMLSEHMKHFNKSIFEAVYWHTTGKYEIDDVGKIVFLADKLDPMKGTRYPYQRLLHDIARKNLDKAMKEFLDREVISLINQGNLVHPEMLAARNAYSR
tara:strand:+ start:8838 stop:9404 length:567 start_codon:yes stop_codon:yes gene_type:complete